MSQPNLKSSLKKPLPGNNRARLNNHFQFVEVGRQEPDKKNLRLRKTEFVEIYQPFNEKRVKSQAHR
ncbi:MAG: hypothetical protein ACPG5T_09150, partial [Endozoicomonas sp.]